MPVPPAGHSSSIDSTSSFSSSKSSLLALPLDDLSSQSDVADAAPASMPRSDVVVYGVADHAATGTPLAGPVSAAQKLKRAFAKHRRPSHDAGLVLSSGDEQYVSDFGPSTSSSHHQFPSSAIGHSPSNRSPAAKLTMQFFGVRKHHGPRHVPPMSDSNQPPPLPPKPAGLAPPSLQIQGSRPNTRLTNANGLRPHNSFNSTSPAITAALEFMREDEERQRAIEQQRRPTPTGSHVEVEEENKEDWRKSDSTTSSGHTVRPGDVGTGASKRFSAVLTTPPEGADLDMLEFLAGAPEPEGALHDTRPVESASTGKRSKRRSMSLSIHIPSTQPPVPPRVLPSISAPSSTPVPHLMQSSATDLGRNTHFPNYSVTSNPIHQVTPAVRHTPSEVINHPGTSGTLMSEITLRGRLPVRTVATSPSHQSHLPISTAAASTSSPSLTTPSVISVYPLPHRRVHVASDASQPSSEVQALAAVRQLQNRIRSPSASSTSSAAGIRQAATSLTSGAGAMALGLGKRAYEKVGRVWGSSQSGSGSGSDTPSRRHPSPSPVSATGSNQGHPFYYPGHAPSAFPAQVRRTPDAHSGAWSVYSMSGSRSSSEKDRAVSGPDPVSSMLASSSAGGLGRLVRPPRGSSGVVFGRELWKCVKDTRAVVPESSQNPLAERLIPALVYRCAQHLHRWGVEEEGLFRISGRSSHIARLRSDFDGGADYDIIECSPSELDPHAVASVFKAYLRELPEPVLTRALSSLFDAAMSAENSRAAPSSSSVMISKTLVGGAPHVPPSPHAIPMLRKPPSLSTFTLPTSSSLRAPSPTLIETLGNLIARLPRENRELLLTVVELMKATAARSKETKMPLSNLLLVFCPSLSMSPTLLRVFCDVPAIWEERLPPVDVPNVHTEAADEDSDESVSDTDLELEDEDLVVLSVNKGKEKELPVMDTQLADPTLMSTSEVANPQTHDLPVSMPLSRPQRAIRRVPVPALVIDNQQMGGSTPNRAFALPLLTDPLPQSGSTSSLELLSQSPSSPGLSEVSLNSPSKPNIHVVALPNRQFASSSSSSAFVPPVTDHNKSLPASPRSPTGPSNELHGLEVFPQLHPTQQTDVYRPTHNESHDSTSPQPRLPMDTYPERSSSMPTPRLVASKSAPDVIFPSSAKTTPGTPTSVKKHTLTLSLGRSPKMSNDEDLPSPSKRMIRRPSLNMLFNIKRNGSPSPRPHTPIISSPCSSPRSLDCASLSVESSPMKATNPFPPVLSLPIESSLGVGLGWDEVFSNSGEATLAPMVPRPTTVSQPSAPWIQAAPTPSRRPTTEYLTFSNSYSGSTGASSVHPSTTSVVEVEVSSSAVQSSSSDLAKIEVGTEKDVLSGNEISVTETRTDQPFSPPPHISFQLRRSSLEDEDWASTVLLAAGKGGVFLA